MSAPRLRVAYSDKYMRWQLGEGHPTNPVRARLAVQLLDQLVPSRVEMDPAVEVTMTSVFHAACRVHDPNYVMRLLEDGECTEFEEPSVGLGHAAAVMFGGTKVLLESLEQRRWEPSVSFNPQGAKHHAMWGRAAGFCALNDMAWAATEATNAGLRVGYLDWDAHHGDGVEVLLRDNLDAVTFSIHQIGIFPNTGDLSNPDQRIYNWPLLKNMGDRELMQGVASALHRFEQHGVDLVLLAAGADGLREDPLTGLAYTMPGLYRAASLLGEWAAKRRTPIVVGGAGGYTPFKETPMAWAGVVATLQRKFEEWL